MNIEERLKVLWRHYLFNILQKHYLHTYTWIKTSYVKPHLLGDLYLELFNWPFFYITKVYQTRSLQPILNSGMYGRERAHFCTRACLKEMFECSLLTNFESFYCTYKFVCTRSKGWFSLLCFNLDIIISYLGGAVKHVSMLHVCTFTSIFMSLMHDHFCV